MTIKIDDLIEYLYSRRTPKIYLDEDAKGGYPFQRYLQALGSGFESILGDIDSLLDLTNPETCPESLFPYLCQCYGFTYSPDIDISYQRKFLSNIGDLIKRQGTYSVVHYLTRVLTGLESNVLYSRETVLNVTSRNLYITLLAKSLEQILNMDTSEKVVEKYLKLQLPFYITPIVNSEIETQVLQANYRRGYSINTYRKYTLIPQIV